MARQPKPWYREDRKVWSVTINGTRHNLGRNKKEAFARFHELMREPKRVAVSAASLPAVIDAFLDWTHRNRSIATYGWYRERLQSFVSEHPNLTIEQLRPFHVEKWSDAPHRTVNTRRNLMRAVKRCFKWACSQGHLDKNPISQLEIPGGTARDVHISPDEFETLFSFIAESCFAELLKVSYQTGCRPQELLRVEARHVDLKHNRWVFPAKEAKTKSRPRIVYLSEYAAQVSERLMIQWPKGQLFRNTKGTPWTPHSVGCAFERLLLRMGKAKFKESGETIEENDIIKLMKQLTPHRIAQGVQVQKSPADLRCEAKRKLINKRARELGTRYSLYGFRHSFATNALQRGVDALTVAILLGHSDPSMLARHYQFLSNSPEHMLAQARRAAG